MKNDINIMISMKELARRLGVSPRTVYRMIADGRFPRACKVGLRGSRWLLSDLEKYIAEVTGQRTFRRLPA